MKQLCLAVFAAALLSGCLGVGLSAGTNPVNVELVSTEMVASACEDGIDNPRKLPFSADTIVQNNRNGTFVVISWVVDVKGTNAIIDEARFRKVNKSYYVLSINTTVKKKTKECRRPVIKYRSPIKVSENGEFMIGVRHNGDNVGHVERTAGTIFSLHKITPANES